MEAAEAESGVDVSVRVQASSRALAPIERSSLVRVEPSQVFETVEVICRFVLGVVGVTLLFTGQVSRVLAETCSVAGRTALILAKGEDVDG
jgi:hypothetical protein